jgi:hypothetical protein
LLGGYEGKYIKKQLFLHKETRKMARFRQEMLLFFTLDSATFTQLFCTRENPKSEESGINSLRARAKRHPIIGLKGIATMLEI